MIRKEAEPLVFFVNDKETMDALFFYTDLRIRYLKDQFIHAKTFDEVLRLQGAIDELTRVKHLRDEVLNPKD